MSQNQMASQTVLKAPIVVPIRVDAVYADGTTNTAGPTLDFTRLKGVMPPPNGNASNALPWLGDTVRPAYGDTYQLPKGLHLHWTLPSALTRGTTVYVLDQGVCNELIQQGVPWSLVHHLLIAAGAPADTTTAFSAEFSPDGFQELAQKLATSGSTPLVQSDFNTLAGTSDNPPTIQVCGMAFDSRYSGDPKLAWDSTFIQVYWPLIAHTAARIQLPRAPNRWLVVRGDGQAWVVESDRLTPPSTSGARPSGAGPTAVPARVDPAAFKDFATNPSAANLFNFLGFHAPAGSWTESGGDQPTLERLTAAGHGVPEFAAFYPDCQGVFGFCDNSTLPASATYTVIGWFAQAEHDPASSSYAEQPWAGTPATTLQQRLDNLRWSLPPSTPPPEIDGSIYVGTVAVTIADCKLQPQSNLPATVQLAVGNTAAEALSARLANDQTLPKGADKPLGLHPQTLLNAAQVGALRHAADADGAAVIDNALHMDQFQSESAGSIWEIAPRPSDAPGLDQAAQLSATQAATLQAALETLNDLNAMQLQFDRTQAYVRSQRRLVFADWCRALHCETDMAAKDHSPWSEYLSMTASAVDAAGAGNYKSEHMLAYFAASSLYLALVKTASCLGKLPSYTLKRKPAPRFYRPNDPVVLWSEQTSAAPSLRFAPDDSKFYTNAALAKTAVAGQPHQSNESWLTCQQLSPAGDPPAWLSGWDTKAGRGPAAACVASAIDLAPVPYPGTVGSKAIQPWRPTLLAWQVRFTAVADKAVADKAVADKTDAPPYSPSFLQDNFRFDPAGIDLVPASATEVPNEVGPCVYDGRVVLSRHAMETLSRRVQALLETVDAGSGAWLEPAKTILAAAATQQLDTLSQALDGFHDRLLSLRRIPQVSVFDPWCASASSPAYVNPNTKATATTDATWVDGLQTFYAEIGNQAIASPVADDIYRPIRAGRCTVAGLTIVDAFGQQRQWVAGSQQNPQQLMTLAQTLPAAKTGSPDQAFVLPPRLAQSARLLFRWIAADGTNQVESNRHPATTPICGWLTLNRVDESILVFAADGTLLGWIPTTQSGAAKLVLAPGSKPQPPSNAHLSLVLAQMEAAPASFYGSAQSVLLNIEPRAQPRQSASSVLLSRPLAIARAALRLELLGTPSPAQGYTEVIPPDEKPIPPAYQPVAGMTSPFDTRSTHGLTQVQFPVRLGDCSMDDDGLAAWWALPPSGSPAQLGAANWISGQDGSAPAEPTVALCADPTNAPTEVLLLIDPRAPVHATSGILPTKEILMPPDVYAEAVERMELMLTVGPVLTPADQLVMPLPAEIAGRWQWLPGAPTSQSTPLSGKVDDRAHPMPAPAVVNSGWLRLKGAEGGK